MSTKVKNLTGVKFVCKNKGCKAFKKELWLNPTWPIGNLDDVLASAPLQRCPDLRDHLILDKEDGRKYALIQLPNRWKEGELEKGVEIVGYRFFLYCPDDKIIWQEDVTFDQLAHEGPEAPQESYPPMALYPYLKGVCQRCNKTLSISDIFIKEKDRPLNCPHCDQEMEKSTWYAQG